MNRKKSHLVIKYASGGRQGIWNTEDGCWKMKPTTDLIAVRKRMDELYKRLNSKTPT